MKKLMLLLVLITPAVAYAGTAFFSYEIPSKNGFKKTCVYDYLGEDYYITISSVKLCPLTIQVN